MIIFGYIAHITFSLILVVPTDLYILKLDLISKIILYSSAVLGSLLPDVDIPNSFLGRIIQPISNIIYFIFGHRTITHSLLINIILYLFLLIITANKLILSGIFLGIVTHIMADMITPSGVSIFYPINKKRISIYKK